MAVAEATVEVAEAEATVEVVFTVAGAASMAEVRRFTAAVSAVAARCSMAADFAPLMFSTVAVSATAGSRFGTIAFTGTSTRPITTTRITIRTTAAG
jgi:hypothetical protein